MIMPPDPKNEKGADTGEKSSGFQRVTEHDDPFESKRNVCQL
jgi:hypothetical protein